MREKRKQQSVTAKKACKVILALMVIITMMPGQKIFASEDAALIPTSVASDNGGTSTDKSQKDPLITDEASAVKTTELGSDANSSVYALPETSTLSLPVEDNSAQASISGVIWHDANKDSVKDENESGLAGYTVRLCDERDVAVASTTTKNDGSYLFGDLASGFYKVKLHSESIQGVPYALSQDPAKAQHDNTFMRENAQEESGAFTTEIIEVNKNKAVASIDAAMSSRAVLRSAAVSPRAGTGVLEINTTNNPITAEESTSLRDALATFNQATIDNASTLKLTGDQNKLFLPTNDFEELLSTINTLDLSAFRGTLDDQAFYGLSNITTVALGNSVTELPFDVFDDCISLTTISDTLANAQANPRVIDLEKTGITTFATNDDPHSGSTGGQFYGCKALTTVTLGSAIQSLSCDIFSDCNALTTISNTLANAQANPGVIDLEKTGISKLELWGGQFYGCTDFVTVTLGNAIKTLPGYSFADCSSLATISNTLANAQANPGVVDLAGTGIRKFGEGEGELFQGCQFLNCKAIETVTLHEDSEKLPNDVFSYCTSLTTVSNTLANAQGESKGLIDLEKIDSLLGVGGYQFDGSNALAYMGENAHSLYQGTCADAQYIFVPRTNTTIDIKGDPYCLILRYGSEGSSPTTINNSEGHYLNGVASYYEVKATTDDGHGSIVKKSGGFLGEAIEARETLEGNLASGKNYAQGATPLTYTITPSPGYKVKSITGADGVTAITPTAIDGNDYTFAGVTENTTFHVTFGLEKTVTEHYVDRKGNAIGLPNTTQAVVEGNRYDYVGDIPTTEGYVYRGFASSDNEPTSTSPSTVTDEARPSIVSVDDNNKDVYLIYGQDRGVTGDDSSGSGLTPDGKEDIDVSRHLKGVEGAVETALSAQDFPESIIVNIEDSPYNIGAPAVNGWRYAGWNQDGSATTYSTDPLSIALVAGSDTKVYFIYGRTLHTISYAIESRGTNPIGGLAAPASQTNMSYGSTFTETAPQAPDKKIYVGWKVGADGAIETGDLTGTVTGDATIYLVYGDDSNNNRVEDVQVTRHLRGIEGTSTTPLTSAGFSEAVTADITAPYNIAAPTVESPGWQYVGWNQDGSATSYTSGNPTIALVGGTNIGVYYIYGRNTHAVIAHYVDRFGNPIGLADNRVNVEYGTAYAGQDASSVSGYLYAGAAYEAPRANEPSLVTGKGKPNLSNVTGDTSVWYVYGKNRVTGSGSGEVVNANDTEDLKVECKWVDADGNALSANLSLRSSYFDIGSLFNLVYDAGVEIPSGWTYEGCKVNGELYSDPSFEVDLRVPLDKTVEYVFARQTNNVTITHVNEQGAKIGSLDTTKQVAYEGSFSYEVPSVTNYTYSHWVLDGALQGSGAPSLDRVTGPHAIQLVYKAVTSDPDNPDQPDPNKPDPKPTPLPTPDSGNTQTNSVKAALSQTGDSNALLLGIAFVGVLGVLLGAWCVGRKAARTRDKRDAS